MNLRRNAFAAITLSTIGVILASSAPFARAAEGEIPLFGAWRFILDPRDVGEREKWATGVLPDVIKLPGSTAESGFGDEISVEASDAFSEGFDILTSLNYARVGSGAYTGTCTPAPY